LARVYLEERAEKYGRLLLEKNGEEKICSGKSENRIDLLILDETKKSKSAKKTENKQVKPTQI
jgi:hypothetical protein